jgi:hypothetical protein
MARRILNRFLSEDIADYGQVQELYEHPRDSRRVASPRIQPAQLLHEDGDVILSPLAIGRVEVEQ